MKIPLPAAIVIILLFLGGVYYFHSTGQLEAYFAGLNLVLLAIFGMLFGLVISGLIIFVGKKAIVRRKK